MFTKTHCQPKSSAWRALAPCVLLNFSLCFAVGLICGTLRAFTLLVALFFALAPCLLPHFCASFRHLGPVSLPIFLPRNGPTFCDPLAVATVHCLFNVSNLVHYATSRAELSIRYWNHKLKIPCCLLDSNPHLGPGLALSC